MTAKYADDLEALWKLSGKDTLTDMEICERLGIPFNNVKNWLQRNTKVQRGEEKEGLRSIRTRAKATTKSSYLQRLFSIMLNAEAAGDLKTAADNLRWLMEKQFPLEFGNRLKLTGDINTGHQMAEVDDEKLREQIQNDLAELARRPECRDFVNDLKTSSTE